METKLKIVTVMISPFLSILYNTGFKHRHKVIQAVCLVSKTAVCIHASHELADLLLQMAETPDSIPALLAAQFQAGKEGLKEGPRVALSFPSPLSFSEYVVG